MSISPITGIAPIAITGAAQIGNATGVTGAAALGSSQPTGASSFASQLDALSAMQNNVDELAIKAATGDLNSIQDYTVASTEAQLMTQLTVTVRNKAVEAFNDIMRMQV
jgi:flagellar hook-basal body complex protein FliE